MDYKTKLKELETKVARLESRHIQQNGLSGFVDYLQEIKEDMVEDDAQIASDLAGYYSNLDKRLDKALANSAMTLSQSLEKVERQIALYERAILSYNKYVGGHNLKDTVYSSPFREADLVLRSSIQKQIQMSQSIKARLDSVLHDLTEMRKDRPNYSMSDGEIEQMVRNLPPKRQITKRPDRSF